MSQLVTIEHPTTTAPASVGKPPRISKRLAAAIRLLASGECKTVKAASERVGMNYTHLCEQMRKPQIEAFCARQAAGNISRGLVRASARMIELIDAQSEHVAANVSTRLLEHGGILRPQTGGHSVNVSINNSISPGYVIDLSGIAPQQPARTVEATAVHCDSTEQDQ